MRKTLIAIAVGAVLTVSACSSGHGTSGASDTKGTAAATASAPQPTGQSSSTQGSSESCPTAADFTRAIQEAVSKGLLAPVRKVSLDSGVVCKDHIAAAWTKLQTDQGENRVVAVLRWRYWRLEQLDMARTDADKRWEAFDASRKFSASATVCEQSPILEWLREQGSCVA